MIIKAPNTDVITYNATSNTFDALITVQDNNRSFTYPCSVEGHINMPLTTAAFKLCQQAKARHKAQDDLRASQSARPEPHLVPTLRELLAA